MRVNRLQALAKKSSSTGAFALLLMLPTSSGLTGDGVVHSTTAPMAGEARNYVHIRCAAAVGGLTSPSNASLNQAMKGTGVSLTPSSATIIDWYYGQTPGRFTATVSGLLSGRKVEIRATVNIRTTPCSLVTWRVVSGAS
jgi:hypothetical protein